jgi:exosortase/archaeosortase family protein
MAGIPVFRHGFTFDLPIVGIEVAKECSSIHSGVSLFVTSLLLGHVLLRSLWAKVCLTVLTVPIAIFTNAIRIFSLWWLATHVNMNFLTGDLHHRGGILFSLISLSILLTFVGGLWKYEQRGSSQTRINKKAALVTG